MAALTLDTGDPVESCYPLESDTLLMNSSYADIFFEIIATSHLFLYGLYLLFSTDKRNIGITFMGFFFLLLGIHFIIIVFGNMNVPYFSPLCQKIFDGGLLKYFLFAYGPLLLLSNKYYLENRSKPGIDILKYFSVLIVPIIFSIGYPTIISWPFQELTFEKTAIYASNLFFIILSFREVKSAEGIIKSQKTLMNHLNHSYLGMILLWVIVLINRDTHVISEPLLKVAFLLILIFMVDGLIYYSLKYPDVIKKNGYLRKRIKHWDFEKYAYADIDPKYGTQILKDLNHFFGQLEKFKQSNVTLKVVSQELGYPERDITQIVNTRLGKNFKEYVNELRIEEARRLIVENPTSRVNEVMYSAGFNSKSIFHKYFKERFGMTPYQYKKSLPVVVKVT